MKLCPFINKRAAAAINPIIAGFKTDNDDCNHGLSFSFEKNAQIIVMIIKGGVLTANVHTNEPMTPCHAANPKFTVAEYPIYVAELKAIVPGTD